MRQITSLAHQTNNFTSVLRNFLIAILQAQKCWQKHRNPLPLYITSTFQRVATCSSCTTSLSASGSVLESLSLPSASNVILTPQTNLILLHIRKHGHVQTASRQCWFWFTNKLMKALLQSLTSRPKKSFANITSDWLSFISSTTM